MRKLKINLENMKILELTVPENFTPKAGMLNGLLVVSLESTNNPDNLRLYGVMTKMIGTQYFWAKSPADAYSQIETLKEDPLHVRVVRLPVYPGDTTIVYEFKEQTGWVKYLGYGKIEYL